MKLFALFLLLLISLKLEAAPIRIVAAENFYGGVAKEIAGSSAEVINIMTNVNQDPHEFQVDAKTAKAVADADIVIYNGLGYDTWMEKLLSASKKKNHPLVINVATLLQLPAGSNPHIWYDPKTMPALATRLGELLHQPATTAAFSKSMQPLLAKIQSLKTKTVGLPVTATEPIFGYMSTALGFQMLNEAYQLAVMNDSIPSFKQTADFEKSLTSHTAKLLFKNSQTANPATERLVHLAEVQKIPVITISELQPLEIKSYVAWMLLELDKISGQLDNTNF